MRHSGGGLVTLAVLVAGGTYALVDARLRNPVEPPEPVVNPSTSRYLVPEDHPLLPARFAGLDDELLASNMLYQPDVQDEVERWVRFWESEPVEWFPSYLSRMTWFEEIVDTTLAAHGLPWSLRYLPIIESGYSPSAVSRASAVGMWQFMAETAEDFGMEVSEHVDARRDPFHSTAAAADFLMELRAEFDSWFLALAAYNAGPHRIRALLERHVPGGERSDAVYWAIRHLLPEETADFVPTLFGAMIVASDPVAHGYEPARPEPFRFDRVEAVGSISFETIARAAGAPRDEIARLNPQYLKGVTPSGRPFELRLPPGSADAFRSYFADQRESGSG